MDTLTQYQDETWIQSAWDSWRAEFYTACHLAAHVATDEDYASKDDDDVATDAYYALLKDDDQTFANPLIRVAGQCHYVEQPCLALHT